MHTVQTVKKISFASVRLSSLENNAIKSSIHARAFRVGMEVAFPWLLPTNVNAISDTRVKTVMPRSISVLRNHAEPMALAQVSSVASVAVAHPVTPESIAKT